MNTIDRISHGCAGLALLIGGGEARSLDRVSGRRQPRKISPLGVFTVEGRAGIYAEALCHKREARRTFRVERISPMV